MKNKHYPAVTTFLVFCATLILFLTPPAVYGQSDKPYYNNKSAADWSHEGDDYSNKGDWVMARECYTKAIGLDPTAKEAYCKRGLMFIQLDRDDEAIKDFSKAIDLDPKYAAAYYERGSEYNFLGRYDEAIADLTKAIDLAGYPYAYFHRGDAYVNLSRYDEAIKDYTKAIDILNLDQAPDIEPGDVNPYNHRGLAYSHLGRYEEAIKDFTKAIDLTGPNPFADAYNNRGLAYSQLGRYEEAIKDLTKAIEIDQSYDLYYDDVDHKMVSIGWYKMTNQDHTMAARLARKHARYYFNRGQVYEAMGQIDNALRDLHEACDLGGEIDVCKELEKLSKWKHRLQGQ